MKIDWDNISIRLASCGRSRHAAGVTNDGWVSDNFDNCLWLVWCGEGEILSRNGWIPLRPGTCLWLPAGWNYTLKYNPNNPIGNYFVHFNLFDNRGKLYTGPFPPEKFYPPDVELVEVTVRRIVYLILKSQNADIVANASYQKPETIIATKLMTGLLMDIDAHTDGDYGLSGINDAHHREAIFEAITRLTETPGKQPNIRELAKDMGYSFDHFIRVFKRIMGRTPKAYALSVRMHKAAGLLGGTNLPIKQIAILAGYETVYSFSAQFKRFTGLCPTEYREKMILENIKKSGNIAHN